MAWFWLEPIGVDLKRGATARSIMTFNIMTFIIITFNITTFSITTLSQ